MKKQKGTFHISKWLMGLTAAEIILLISKTSKTREKEELMKYITQYFSYDSNENIIFHSKKTTLNEARISTLLKNIEYIDYSVLNLEWLETLESSFQYPKEKYQVLEKFDLKLMTIFKPLLINSLVRLELLLSKIPSRKTIWNKKQAVSLLLPNIIGKLQIISEHTLLLEFEVAKLNGLIKGKNSHEYILNYYILLNTRKYQISIMNEYAVLTRKIIIAINSWVTYTVNLFARLTNDYQEITNTFNSNKLIGNLKQITFIGDSATSDVALISFTENLSIVYKFRSLNLEKEFYEFISTHNKVNKTQLTSIKILSENNYGWMEYVSSQDIDDNFNLAKFTAQMGTILVYLYIFQSTDMHYGNIVIGKHGPVIIDLETLFQPRKTNDKLTESNIDDLGFIPNIEHNQNGDLDNYSLGAIISIINKKLNLNILKNPKKNTQKILNDTLTILSDNFSKTYKSLLLDKKNLFNVLNKFHNLKSRYIHRSHLTYFKLTKNSNHPDNLRSGLISDSSYSSLWNGYFRKPETPVIPVNEHHALIRNKFPYLYTLIDSNDLYSEEKLIVSEYFTYSPFESVKLIIDRLGTNDLNFLIKEIHSSFKILLDRNKEVL